MKNVYFDNNATTKIDKEVLNEMMIYLSEEYGNASSIYKLGRDAKKAIENAREKIANAIKAKPEEIYFTSGGTESDNTAIKGIAHQYRQKGNHIITSVIEHPAILETCKQLEKEGFDITYLPVDEFGLIHLDALKKAIKESTILISIMTANNEIGTIEPIKEIGRIAKENNIYFHTDAVQAIGSIRLDVNEMNIDSLSISAHKIYGPKGIGALYMKKTVKFLPLLTGGHQEKKKRAGTENVASIVGFGKAIEIAYRDLEINHNHILALRDYYFAQISEKIPYVKINGDLKQRLAGNANHSFRFVEGEGILLNLDLKGICASSGSACTSGSLDPSHVLLAIGLPHEIAHGSLRISIGKYNTKEEIDYLVENLEEIIKKLRTMSPLYDRFLKEDKYGTIQ